MLRTLALSLVTLVACSGKSTPTDAAPATDAVITDAVIADAATTDAVDCDGGCAGENEACGTSEVDLDAGAAICAPGLVCCYPCGIEGCVNRCRVPCGEPGPGCQENGCPGPFP